MDRIDILLYRELAQGGFMDYFRSDARISAVDLAEKINVDQTMVKRRLAKWQKIGFLKNIRVEPKLSLFGLQKALYDFKIKKNPKQDSISSLKLIDGVIFIIDMFGDWVRVEFAYDSENDLKKKTNLFKNLMGATEYLDIHHVPVPITDRVLSKTDWKIVRSLRYDMKKSFIKVAEETRLSTKTIKRRYYYLTRNKLIVARPYLNLGNYPGSIFASIIVFYSGKVPREEVNQDLLSKFQNNYLLSMLSSPIHAIFMLSFNSLFEIKKVKEDLSGIPGVKNVKTDLWTDFIVVDDWIDRKIDRMIE